MKKGKYNHLLKQYPEFISKEQFYKICKISKESARLLLELSVVPSKNNGKLTRRYKIATTDVVEYLRKRDVYGSQIPCGVRRPLIKENDAAFECSDYRENLLEYFGGLFASYPDVVSTYELADMLGYSRSCILEWMKNGLIEGFRVRNQYMAPKECVLDFISSRRYQCIRKKSGKHIEYLGGFERWLTAK